MSVLGGAVGYNYPSQGGLGAQQGTAYWNYMTDAWYPQKPLWESEEEKKKKQAAYESALKELSAQLKVAGQAMAVETKKVEEKNMFGYAKTYLEKHKDTVMTVSFVLLVDHFFLGGALRERIKSLLEGVLDTAQKKLSHTPAAVEKKNAA
jgi:hypothetical protein